MKARVIQFPFRSKGVPDVEYRRGPALPPAGERPIFISTGYYRNQRYSIQNMGDESAEPWRLVDRDTFRSKDLPTLEAAMYEAALWHVKRVR